MNHTHRVSPFILLLPAAMTTAGVFLLPVAWLANMSFITIKSGGILSSKYTLDSYVQLFSDPFTVTITAHSIFLALTVTFLSLVLSYPIALALFRSESRWTGALTVLLVSPLLVSSVVRTYGWIVILGERGWVNFVVQTLGMSSSPLKLMNNFAGVVVALTEILMPYMALSLISGFGRIEVRYEEAAITLGASPWSTFWRVTFPLSLPGVAVGSLICFALAISSFVTPQLLGGGRVFLLSTEIYDGALVTLNWPRAAALSMLLLTLLITAVLVFNRYMKHLEEQ